MQFNSISKEQKYSMNNFEKLENIFAYKEEIIEELVEIWVVIKTTYKIYR